MNYCFNYIRTHETIYKTIQTVFGKQKLLNMLMHVCIFLSLRSSKLSKVVDEAS